MLLFVHILFALLLPAKAETARIPSAPLMTTTRSDNAQQGIPIFRIGVADSDESPKETKESLEVGSILATCIPLRKGQPILDKDGLPFLGYRILFDPRQASAKSSSLINEELHHIMAQKVLNHHCAASQLDVVQAKNLIGRAVAPWLQPVTKAIPNIQPPGRERPPSEKVGSLSKHDLLIREFHQSDECLNANKDTRNRRENLEEAWYRFIAKMTGRWSKSDLMESHHLDTTIRTAIFESNLKQACSHFGLCERNIIALTIRNRAVEKCDQRKGCRYHGDFHGVSSLPSQYHIWNESYTQSGELTSCFLRAGAAGNTRIRQVYLRSISDIDQILFAGDEGLMAVFPGTSLSELKRVQHYYHPLGMGKCFPDRPNARLISMALIRNGGDHALIVGQYVNLDDANPLGRTFKVLNVTTTPDGFDRIETKDSYPGFRLDPAIAPKPELERCKPYGAPPGCTWGKVGCFRRLPSWATDGQPIKIQCRSTATDENCQGASRTIDLVIGGPCDRRIQPIMGVD